jgi:hypothetical protein
MRSASASVLIAAALATACGGSSGEGAPQVPSATASPSASTRSTEPGTGSRATARVGRVPGARVVSLAAATINDPDENVVDLPTPIPR